MVIEEVVAANDRAVEICWNDTKAAHFCVDFCDEKFPMSNDLLLFGLYHRTWYSVAQYDALRMELNARPTVDFEVINGDELFSMFNDLA